MAQRNDGIPGLATAAWILGVGGAIGAIAAALGRSPAPPSEIRPEPQPAVALTAAGPSPAPGLPEPMTAGKHGDDGTSSWPASFRPTAKRPTPVAMRLEPDGTSAWPTSFHPTPTRPNPLTVCLEDDGPSGGTVCPGSTEQLAIPLR